MLERIVEWSGFEYSHVRRDQPKDGGAVARRERSVKAFHRGDDICRITPAVRRQDNVASGWSRECTRPPGSNVDDRLGEFLDSGISFIAQLERS